jgi:phosphoribosyl 1,2-cyclic phosphodiesterase
VRITFWGVRGSYPVPGPSTVRYGGHTSCVEVRASSGACLVIDAGTGLRALGQKLAAEQRAAGPNSGSDRYDLILSHVHWDHIQGLPFFEPAYLPGTHLTIHGLRVATEELRQVITGITRREFFPVRLEAVPADFDFHEVTPQRSFRIREFEVTPFALNHPFGAVGYRVDADGTSLAYVSDTAPFTDILHKQHFLPGPEEPTPEDKRALIEMRDALVASLTGVDTVIYDTHFLPEEYEQFPHFGHSSPDHALEICTGIGVRRLVLYHHAPSHTDDVMDEIAARYAAEGAKLGIDVITARERMEIGVGPSATREAGA